MSFLRKLFDRVQKHSTSSIELAPTRGFQQAVVGESHYQVAIGRIVGGKSVYSASHPCEALLVCDDNNSHDANAVEVRVEGATVGYLPREDANRYRVEIGQLDPTSPPASVRAKITGGWSNEDSEGDFGVKLNLKWPLAPKGK